MCGSMPCYGSNRKLYTEQYLRIGTTGKNGQIGSICDKNATNFLAAGQRADRVGSARSIRLCSSGF